MLIRFGKLAGISLSILIVVPVIIFAIKYFNCPVFEFEKPMSFSGNIFFNPYDEIDSSQWNKANFQVQSYAWMGLTAGKLNTNEKIYQTYSELGYDIIATSDYQKINRHRNDQPDYLPVYEHGYGIKKSHQVLIGSRKVTWLDYPFFQTIHNKQHVLNELRLCNDLVYIAHPKLLNGYTVRNMELLANYDGIEVLNNIRNSFDHWDAALSAGNYVTIIGNDDAHNIANPSEVGHSCTFINCDTINREAITIALRQGKAYGATINQRKDESFEEKKARMKILPALNSVKILGDTLIVSTDSLAMEVLFIGQEGKLVQKTTDTRIAKYVLKKSDTYIRTEIKFYSNHVYYLNPVCRTENGIPAKLKIPETDHYKTSLLRFLGFAILGFILNIKFIIRRILMTRKLI